jgi:LysM repeat protein
MSRQYGVPLGSIEQHNPGITNRHLRIGETIIIPAPFAGGETLTFPATPPVHRFDGQHVVRQGDTLWSISRTYGVDPQALADANDMELNQILHEGRTLRVPIIE